MDTLRVRGMTSDQIVSDASSTVSASASKKTSKPKKRKPLEKGTKEYRKRREKNNEAVKKSRTKSKEKMNETQEQVNKLIMENQELQNKVQNLSKEFEVLRDLYTSHITISNLPMENLDLTSLIQPESTDTHY